MSGFDEKTIYLCPNCGHTEAIRLYGWSKAPEKLKCPVCYEMMSVSGERDGNS